MAVLTGALGRTDPVVGVLVCALLLASVFSWAVILSRVVGLRRFGRALAQVETFARQPGAAPAHPSHLFAALVAADAAECAREPEADRGQREIAMRAAYMMELRRHEAGLPFLATLASAAPFIGLFGTVWGIMESFSSIAAANDTSLSVVAPGIAGALFATAVGLAAAIPAVVAYNLIRAGLAGFSHRLAAAAFLIARDVETGAARKAA